MDYVKGTPLRMAVEAGPTCLAGRSICRQMLSALGHAHAQGIVHRDIKPENIVLEATPGLTDHVRVLDFGLAKLMGSDSGLTVGMAIGTPNYMAPEQTREGKVDFRADLYAVGIVLYEMLTGKKPFDGEVGEVFMKQLGMPAPRLRETAPEAGFSPELEAVVLRAMDKQPDGRFDDAQTMSFALELVPEANATPRPAPMVVAPGPASDATLLRQGTPPPLFTGETTNPDRPLSRAALDPGPPPAPGPVEPARSRGGFPWGTAVIGASLVVALGITFRPRAPAPAPVPDARAASAPAGASHRPGADPAPAGPATRSTATAEPAAQRRTTVEPRAERRARASTRSSRPSASVAATQAREHFEARRWSAGIDSFRMAARLEPERKSDPALLNPLIGSLDSDSKGERAAFLRELGQAARPALRQAARSHPSPKVRARASELLGGPERPPAPPRKKPFLRWL